MHTRVERTQRNVITVLGVVLAMVIGGRASSAQETTTGALAGQVVDAQGLAVPGATVTVTTPQGPKSAVTDAQGSFLVPFLVPGVHSVRVELSGFKPAEMNQVNVQLGDRTTLPAITLLIGSLTEAVEVVAAPPVVDTRSTTVGASMDSEFLARLPVPRQLSDTLYLAPGVSGSGRAGQANPSISGGSGLENQYLIDGINVTDSGYGALGSYSIIFGSLGTGVPFDFINEVRVKTGAYEAEFGQSTGGVVQAVTKSGGNQFRGTVFAYTQPSAFQGTFRQTVLPNATRGSEAVNTTGTSDSDAGIEIGGPILPDRLFFFGALDPQWRTTELVAPSNRPLASLGSVNRDRQLTAYSAKATYQPASAHRLDASVFGDPAHGDLGPQRRTSLLRDGPTGFSSLNYGGHNQTLRYGGVLGSQLLVTASLSRSSNFIDETPQTDQYSILDTTVTPNARRGGLGYVENIDGQNLQYQAKATYVWPAHEVKGGFLLEDIDYNNIIDRTGPTFTLPDGTATATGADITVFPDPAFGQIFRVTRANLSNIRSTSQRYTSFFVQDTWKVNDRLTLKPGLRYERQTLNGNLAQYTWDGNWSPRIGVIWDPTASGRLKLFANYGRYFAKVPNDLAARALSADAGVTRADYFDVGLTRPVPAGTTAAGTTVHFRTAGLSAADFDPNSKSTYSNEWLTGAEYEIMPGFRVGVNYIHRTFGRVLEDVGTLPMAAYFLPDVPGADSVEYFITNPGPATPVVGNLGASFETPIHDYDAVTVTAEKRFAARWGLQSSYRWSRLHGTFEGFFRNDNGQSDPAITSLFDFPTNDPSYVAVGVNQLGFGRGNIRFLGDAGAGPLPLDRTHHAKLFGNYLLPRNINLGLGVSVLSGTPLTAFAANPLYESAGEIPETPRGGGIETVDGFRTRTPWSAQIDAHADYALSLGGNRKLTLLADVFNLFNNRDAQQYDYYTEIAPNRPNPDFGRVIDYRAPLQFRIGARFGF
jgi:outer membrane receptor protein involved in Fe transport